MGLKGYQRAKFKVKQSDIIKFIIIIIIIDRV